MSEQETSEEPEWCYRPSRRGGNKGCLHADPNCSGLKNSRTTNVLKKRTSIYPDWYDRCDTCWPTKEDTDE